MSRPGGSDQRTVCRWTSTTPHPTAYARDQLRRALSALGMDDDGVDDTVLAASEIVANATEHAEGPYELSLRRSGRYLLVEVHDRSCRMPVLPDAGAFPVKEPPLSESGRLDVLISELTERGRGLAIVHTLVQGRLTARRTPTGKCVTIAVPRP